MSLSEITPQDYGALGNGSNADDQALQAAINQALKSGHNLFIPAGKYHVTQPILVDLSLLQDPVSGAKTTNGIMIYGEGQWSRLIFAPSTDPYPSPLFVIEDARASTDPNLPPWPPTGTNPTVPVPTNTYSFFHMHDLLIAGRTIYSSSAPNPVLQIGRSDFRDNLFDCRFTNIEVNNFAASGSTVGQALAINSARNCEFQGMFLSANTEAVSVVSAQFCRLRMSCQTASTSTSYPALHIPNISNAYPISNSFLSLYCNSTAPGVGIGIQIDSPQAHGNVIMSPFFDGVQTGVVVTQGSNRMISPYYNSNVTAQTLITSPGQLTIEP